MLTLVEPQVVLFLSEDPHRFQARVSGLAAHFLGLQLERTSRLGGDSPLSNMGRVLTAIAATELLLKEDFAKRGTDFLTASLNLGDQGEFLLEVKFTPEFSAPNHSTTTIQ